jgi:hypothetical protein
MRTIAERMCAHYAHALEAECVCDIQCYHVFGYLVTLLCFWLCSSNRIVTKNTLLDTSNFNAFHWYFRLYHIEIPSWHTHHNYKISTYLNWSTYRTFSRNRTPQRRRDIEARAIYTFSDELIDSEIEQMSRRGTFLHPYTWKLHWLYYTIYSGLCINFCTFLPGDINVFSIYRIIWTSTERTDAQRGLCRVIILVFLQ